ncbi:MAG TPA: YbfB/YjiJ family MFS transporter [Candidatus Thioglobus sp.]|nr:YbfB/YjiJ family MFS transporter [Candidatus Thioglobus sp.]
MRISLFNKDSNFNILLAGIISLFVAIGVARFSYTSLLPAMLDDETISLAFSGVMASVNYVGYLLGALFAIFIKSMSIKVKCFRLGLLLCVITTLIIGITDNDYWWLASRIVAGFSSAMVMVIGSAIIMMKLNLENKTKAMGIYFSGIGVALVASDMIGRYVLSISSWQTSWLVLALSAALVVFYPWHVLSFAKTVKQSVIKQSFNPVLFSGFVLILITAYFTAGVGFVVQGTFLPTIIKSLPGLEAYAGLTWILVGLAGIPSSVIWMHLAHKYGDINIIIIAMSIQIVGILIPAITTNIYLNLLSGIFYGGTFVGLVALFIHLGGKLAQHNPIVLMGALTAAYGVGQVGAPLYAVTLTNWSGNYNYALYVTALIVFSGVLMLLTTKMSKSPY